MTDPLSNIDICKACRARFSNYDGEVVDDLCCLCFGLLCPFPLDSYATSICNAVQESGHEISTFKLTMALPGGIPAKRRALLTHLSVASQPPYIRDVLRDKLIQLLEVKLDAVYDASSTMDIYLEFIHHESESELCAVFGSGSSGNMPSRRKKAKTSVQANPWSNGAITRLLNNMSDAEVMAILSPPKSCKTTASLSNIKIIRGEPLYIAGRYVKLSREMPQSPWFIANDRKGVSSVEECVCGPLESYVKCDEWKFHAAGREDIDVRMLGNGRPFIARGTNPRAIDAPQTLEDLVFEGPVIIDQLKVVDSTAFDRLILGEHEKKKHYRAVVWCGEDVSVPSLSVPFDIHQKTPIRVLHRRAAAVRTRTIYYIKIEPIAPHFMVVDLVCQAGTYVKEFVHGEFGRTKPSLGDLLMVEKPSANVRILQLDVTNVEWDLYCEGEAPASCRLS